MNYMFKSLKPTNYFYIDYKLEDLHSNYKKCIAKEVESFFVNQDFEAKGELCLEEKRIFYRYLHENDKIEHDNIMRYYHSIV